MMPCIRASTLVREQRSTLILSRMRHVSTVRVQPRQRIPAPHVRVRVALSLCSLADALQSPMILNEGRPINFTDSRFLTSSLKTPPPPLVPRSIQLARARCGRTSLRQRLPPHSARFALHERQLRARADPSRIPRAIRLTGATSPLRGTSAIGTVHPPVANIPGNVGSWRGIASRQAWRKRDNNSDP